MLFLVLVISGAVVFPPCVPSLFSVCLWQRKVRLDLPIFFVDLLVCRTVLIVKIRVAVVLLPLCLLCCCPVCWQRQNFSLFCSFD